MRFVAFDVETANADLASICQVGAVVFEAGKPVESWETLVDPEDYFDAVNVSIHGIKREHVKGAPKFPEIYDRLSELLATRIVAHHMPFDKLAMARVKSKYSRNPIACHWLDTARVVRKTWAEFSRKGYGLANITKHLGITFRHHSAVEDARAAGEVLVHAIRHSGVSIDEWLTTMTRSSPTSTAARSRRS